MLERVREYFNRLQNLCSRDAVNYADTFLQAAETGDLTVLRRHFDMGGDAAGSLSRMCMVSAAAAGSSAAVDFLLEKGVSAQSHSGGKTAEQAARENGHAAIADKLKKLQKPGGPAVRANSL